MGSNPHIAAAEGASPRSHGLVGHVVVLEICKVSAVQELTATLLISDEDCIKTATCNLLEFNLFHTVTSLWCLALCRIRRNRAFSRPPWRPALLKSKSAFAGKSCSPSKCHRAS